MLRKILISLLVVCMIFGGNTSEYEASTKIEKEEVVVGESSDYSIERIIEESIIKTRSASSVEGTYKSGELETGVPGYTYRVSFEWCVISDSEGHYLFSEIYNIKVTTYVYDNLLEPMWSSYWYDLDVEEPTYSDGKSVVNIEMNYTFYTIRKYDFFGNVNKTEKTIELSKTASSLAK